MATNHEALPAALLASHILHSKWRPDKERAPRHAVYNPILRNIPFSSLLSNFLAHTPPCEAQTKVPRNCKYSLQTVSSRTRSAATLPANTAAHTLHQKLNAQDSSSMLFEIKSGNGCAANEVLMYISPGKDKLKYHQHR